jgi:hypothetical protein
VLSVSSVVNSFQETREASLDWRKAPSADEQRITTEITEGHGGK